MNQQRPHSAERAALVAITLLQRSEAVGRHEAAALRSLANRGDWDSLTNALEHLSGSIGWRSSPLSASLGGSFGPSEESPQAIRDNLASVLLMLFRMLEAMHPSLPRARKLSAVYRDLEAAAGSAADSELLTRRLRSTIASWGPALASIPAGQLSAPSPDASQTSAAGTSSIEISAAYQRLIGTLAGNLEGLGPEDAWLAGQFALLTVIGAGQPDAATIEKTSDRLAALIAEQRASRASLNAARNALTDMLPTLSDRLGRTGQAAERFATQMDGYAQALPQMQASDEVTKVLRSMQAAAYETANEVRASHREIAGAQAAVSAYKDRVMELETELGKLAEMVQRDPLTRALNRRGLEDAFRLETARSLRHGTPLAAALIDLDNFKDLNDTLGHLAGDRALVHVLTVLTSTLRGTDVVTRIGGEEFVVLFSGTRAEDAAASIRRALDALARRPLEHEGLHRTLTFSAGATEWRGDEQLDALIARADRLMYRAKKAGKCRVETDAQHGGDSADSRTAPYERSAK